jgi:hypothetical protein
MFTPSTLSPLGRCLRASADRCGKAARQGPHHVAQNCGEGADRVNGVGLPECLQQPPVCSAGDKTHAAVAIQAEDRTSITIGPVLDGTATGSPLMNVRPAAGGSRAMRRVLPRGRGAAAPAAPHHPLLRARTLTPLCVRMPTHLSKGTVSPQAPCSRCVSRACSDAAGINPRIENKVAFSVLLAHLLPSERRQPPGATCAVQPPGQTDCKASIHKPFFEPTKNRFSVGLHLPEQEARAPGHANTQNTPAGVPAAAPLAPRRAAAPTTQRLLLSCTRAGVLRSADLLAPGRRLAADLRAAAAAAAAAAGGGSGCPPTVWPRAPPPNAVLVKRFTWRWSSPPCRA